MAHKELHQRSLAVVMPPGTKDLVNPKLPSWCLSLAELHRASHLTFKERIQTAQSERWQTNCSHLSMTHLASCLSEQLGSFFLVGFSNTRNNYLAHYPGYWNREAETKNKARIAFSHKTCLPDILEGWPPYGTSLFLPVHIQTTLIQSRTGA